MLDLSIVIINKNYINYLRKCLISCLNQNTKYLYEVIVVDDGSTDGSIDFVNNIKNKKIKFFQTNNKGIEIAANKGFRKSKAEYVVRVDSDDYLSKNFVNIMLNEANSSKASFIYSNYYTTSLKKKLKVYLPDFNKKEIIQRGDFLATGTVYHRKTIKKFGYYNEKTKNSGLENYELILKLIIKQNYGKRVKKCLFTYRKHKGNLSILKKKKIVNFGKKIFKKMKLGTYKKNKYHPWN